MRCRGQGTARRAARSVNHAVGSAAGYGDAGAATKACCAGSTVCFQYARPQINWLPGGLTVDEMVLRDFRPDLIFASAPPHTALIAADRSARCHRMPWVTEYRDRWTEDPYDSPPPWRSRFDRWIEDRVIGSAAAIVTVSEPWAEGYRARWRKPVEVIYNGLDPNDSRSTLRTLPRRLKGSRSSMSEFSIQIDMIGRRWSVRWRRWERRPLRSDPLLRRRTGHVWQDGRTLHRTARPDGGDACHLRRSESMDLGMVRGLSMSC